MSKADDHGVRGAKQSPVTDESDLLRRSAFQKMMAGAEDALAIADGTADPKTYRVHYAPDARDVDRKQN